jgi:hypothetical protein
VHALNKTRKNVYFIAVPASDSSPLVRVKRMKGKNCVSCVLDTAERRYCIVSPKKRLIQHIYFLASPVTLHCTVPDHLLPIKY